ncbi:MAG: YicC family protein [Porphyromonas sp.]|nr:MAG: YicC family protein [Porphyromonas sp.]
MVLSMTGVGKSIVRHNNKTIIIFVKTLNSKQIDISTRIPALYREKELELRTMVSEKLVRGKVELSISIDDANTSLSGVQQINVEALRYYKEQLDNLNKELGLELGSTEQLLKLPGVFVSTESSIQELGDEEWAVVRQGLEEALEAVSAFRRQEGCMLEDVLRQSIKNIRSLLSKVDIPEQERIQQIRQKIEEGLKKLSIDGYDRGRLEQEMIYYIEKLDINEEKNRLRNHLDYFEAELDLSEGIQGKTLGFVAQEIGREINTLGSKSNNADMQQIVVKMKDELEQIKEQTLNIL